MSIKQQSCVEAMKQALEALNEVTGWQWAGPMRVMDEVEDAITSLRLAIAESEKQEPVAYMYPDDLEEFKTREMSAHAYSLEMVSPTQGETVPLYTHPYVPTERQPKAEQDEVDIRSRLYQRVHELEAVLKDIMEYTGEGPSTTDWQGIVKLISDSARSALGEQI